MTKRQRADNGVRRKPAMPDAQTDPVLFTVVKKTEYTATKLAGIKHLPLLHDLVKDVMRSEGDPAKKEAFARMVYDRIDAVTDNRKKKPSKDNKPTTLAAPGK